MSTIKCQPGQHQWTDWYVVKSIRKRTEQMRRHCTVCKEIEDGQAVSTVEIVRQTVAEDTPANNWWKR